MGTASFLVVLDFDWVVLLDLLGMIFTESNGMVLWMQP